MKSFLVIGMGRFGSALAYKLTELGHEVVIADRDSRLIETLAPDFADAQIADCTNLAQLESMDVSHFDVCAVCAGENFQASLEITDNLKQLGARRVVSKANRVNQAKFLAKIGADEVVYPEKESAEKTALRLATAGGIADFLALPGGFGVYELPVPGDWVGRSLSDLGVRRRLGLTVLAVRNGERLVASPAADYAFSPGDVAIAFGAEDDAARAAKANF